MEWWKLWVPFIGTLITAIINIWISLKQKKNAQEFDLKLQEQQNEFERNITKQKINADIISKSRMHWMDETKEIATEFLNTSLSLGSQITMFAEKCLQYRNYINEYELMKLKSNDKGIPAKERNQAKEMYEAWKNEDQSSFSKDMIKRSEAINNAMEINKKNYMLLRLNFSDNGENNEIINLAKEIHEDLRKASLSISWMQFDSLNIQEEKIKKTRSSRDKNALMINELVDLLRGYYKREWEKVKLGK